MTFNEMLRKRQPSSQTFAPLALPMLVRATSCRTFMRQCLGRNRSFARCGRQVNSWFCGDHRWQPLATAVSVLLAVGAIARACNTFMSNDLTEVRRLLDDQKLTEAVLRAEYPWGHAVLYLDAERELREVQRA